MSLRFTCFLLCFVCVSVCTSSKVSVLSLEWFRFKNGEKLPHKLMLCAHLVHKSATCSVQVPLSAFVRVCCTCCTLKNVNPPAHTAGCGGTGLLHSQNWLELNQQKCSGKEFPLFKHWFYFADVCMTCVADSLPKGKFCSMELFQAVQKRRICNLCSCPYPLLHQMWWHI